MSNNLDYIRNMLNTVLSGLIADPLKTISAFASSGALILGWKNLTKDNTRVSIIVKRADNGPLILQNPEKEFLIFEVYNQGVSPVVINEVGIQVPGKLRNKNKFINLVDLAYSDTYLKGQTDAIGSLECIGLPGTIPARTTGVFLLDYSNMKEAAIHEKQSISSTSQEFVGSQRIIKTFQVFKKLEKNQGKSLQITPYVLTGSGNRFIGKKAIVKLGSLGEAIA